MPEIMTVTLTTFSEEERRAVKDLKEKRLLSKAVSQALHDYLIKLNPRVADAAGLIEINTPEDIEEYIKHRRTQKYLSNFLAAGIRETLNKHLLLGEKVVVNSTTGEVEYLPK